MTFSFNQGLPTESTSYDLWINQDFEDLLNRLKDNEIKFIHPRNIRDAILSLWSSVPFKETKSNSSSISYIGLDSVNPTLPYPNRDIKERKIYLGKRDYQSDNIMKDSLLLSDVDIFINNTRLDTNNQSSTRVAILSGYESSLYKNAPYLQTQIISGTTQSISFDFINKNGDINLLGNVGLNKMINGYPNGSITFPTVIESGLSASNDKILYMEGGKLVWDFVRFPVLSSIGTTSSELNIYGTPTNINNFPIEFTDSRLCPIEIGDIKFGDTFNNTPISECLRRLIYNYLPPSCEIKILGNYSSGIVEVGTYPTPTLEYKIYKKTLNTVTTGLSNMIPGNYQPIISNSYEIVTGSSSGIVISPITTQSTEFKITVGDGLNSSSSSTFISGIYPYFYGFTSVSIINSISLVTLSKLVEDEGDKELNIFGSGNLFFIYDSDYNPLIDIIDGGGNSVLSSFTLSIVILSSPEGLWAAKSFNIYQHNGVSQLDPFAKYKFKY